MKGRWGPMGWLSGDLLCSQDDQGTSCFSVAMVKHHGRGSLQKEGFVWVQGSRGSESITNTQEHGCSRQQAAGMRWSSS